MNPVLLAWFVIVLRGLGFGWGRHRNCCVFLFGWVGFVVLWNHHRLDRPIRPFSLSTQPSSPFPFTNQKTHQVESPAVDEHHDGLQGLALLLLVGGCLHVQVEALRLRARAGQALFVYVDKRK